MPDVSVDAAVEKMVRGTPAGSPAPETPTAPETPAKPAPVTNGGEGSDQGGASAEGAEEARGSDGLTAFERELIAENQAEYDTLTDTTAKKAFLTSVKRTARKHAKQMTELGSFRKAITALKEAGVTNDDLVALVSRKKSGPSAPAATEATPKSKGFQRYLEEVTDPAEREHLRTAQQVLREEFDTWVQEFKDKEVKPWQEKLSAA